MKKFSFYFLSLSALMLFSTTVIAATMSSSNYQISGDVFGAGGDDESTSASYSLQDTIGETIIRSATSTSANYGIKAGFHELYFDYSLTLSVGSTAIDFGTFTNVSSATDSHTITVATNAVNGMTLTASGNTLTGGANTITAIGSTAAASAIGTEQFGINLVDNTTPNIGSDLSGTAPVASVANQFNTPDLFAFDDVSSNTIATSTNAINSTELTVSYLVNIGASTEGGLYSTTLTYSVTGNF